jgi:hypothetical protein
MKIQTKERVQQTEVLMQRNRLLVEQNEFLRQQAVHLRNLAHHTLQANEFNQAVLRAQMGISEKDELNEEKIREIQEFQQGQRDAYEELYHHDISLAANMEEA